MESVIKERKKTRKGFETEDWPKEYLEKVECPLCQSVLYGKLFPEYYGRIVKCSSCSLIYTNPRLKKEHLKHLYSEEYFHNSESTHFGYENYLGDEAKIVTTFNKRVEKIESFIQRGKLLDIGCATGFFMKAALDRGWKVEGIEISKFASNYARTHFKFKVLTKDFISLKISPQKYSLITLWDVIEHFYNPVKAIKKAHSYLKKDGLLVLSTPDVGSFPARITNHRWVGYKLSDEHLTYFSKKTITRLLEQNGFEVVKIDHIGKHVSLDMLGDRIAIYNKSIGAIFKKLGKLLPEKFFLYINPFDIMCIYAKKK